MRKLWVQIHLWLGLTIGLALAIVSLSGAGLALSTPLAKWELGWMLFPKGIDQHAFAAMPASSLPLDQWIETARKAYPELHTVEVIAAPLSVPFPASVPLLAGAMDPALTKGKDLHIVVSVNPASGQPIGRIILEDTFLGNLLSFHATLLGGAAGFYLVAASGFVALISLFSGLYLWWPRGVSWSQGFKLRTQSRGRLWLVSLHSVSAAWLFVPLILAILSGSYLLTPAPYNRIATLMSPIREYRPAGPDRTPENCVQQITTDQAVRSALSVHEGLALRLVTKPENPCAPYIVSLSTQERLKSRALYTEVWVDRQSAKVLASRRGDNLTASETLQAWITPVHANLAAGVFGTMVVVLTGLAVPALYVTGLLAWLRQQRTRRADIANAAPSSDEPLRG